MSNLRKTKADKLLDAIQEEKEQNKSKTGGCLSCGNTSFASRHVLGGPSIKVCTVCGTKKYKHKNPATIALTKHTIDPENNTITDGKGPYYSSASPSTSSKNKHLPKYKSKGKPRRNNE